MVKLYLTFELDSLREVGEVLQDIEDNGLGKTVSNVMVDINDDTGDDFDIDHNQHKYLMEKRWDILDENGEFIKNVASEQIVRGDW